jgi:3-dehydroquinate synthetase
MSTIKVKAERSYEILIDVDWKSELVRLSEGRTRTALIVSEDMKSKVGDLNFGDTEIFTFPVPDGESGKSSETLLQVWNWLGAAGFTRNDLVIAVGGGATTDFGGFAAASWLRGIDWIAVPTTVAGMVDAAVGGKTAINSDYGKNLIGAFHSPISVVVDFTWLETLSDRDYAAGLAEVVKAGFIADDGQRGVVAHRPNGFLAIFDHRREDHFDIFQCHARSDLTLGQFRARPCGGGIPTSVGQVGDAAESSDQCAIILLGRNEVLQLAVTV